MQIWSRERVIITEWDAKMFFIYTKYLKVNVNGGSWDVCSRVLTNADYCCSFLILKFS